MNNKIIARIMAAVICVCMMSTVAFAADPTLTVGDETATLSFVADGTDITVSDEAQITMMAYLVDATVATPADIPAYTNQTVIALDQVAGADGFGEVLVAASKLEESKKIAVIVGGSDGDTVSYLIAQEVNEEDDEIIITFMNGDTATPVVAADGKVTLPTAAETAFWGTPATGLTFTLYSWVALDESGNVTAEYKVADTTEIDAVAGTTLYAKYATGYKVGMSNASDTVVDGSDTSALNIYTLRGRSTTANALVNADLYTGSTFKLGDINGDGLVDGSDTSALNVYTLRGRTTTANANVNKSVYIVHKTPVMVAE